MSLVDFISYGASKAELSSIIIYTFCMTHITIVAVTVFCIDVKPIDRSNLVQLFLIFLDSGYGLPREWLQKNGQQYIGNTMLNVKARMIPTVPRLKEYPQCYGVVPSCTEKLPRIKNA